MEPIFKPIHIKYITLSIFMSIYIYTPKIIGYINRYFLSSDF